MPGTSRSIVFAGGGTGGHLFPALAVADELRRRLPDLAIEFIGARRGLERRLVPEAGYPLRMLHLSGIQGRGWRGRIAAGAAAGWAVARCAGWFLARRPALVIGVGGYASGPAVLAAARLRVPTMVMEQNHYPGATNRWLASRVDRVCVPSEAARRRLGGRGIVTGNPVRREFFEIGPPPGRAMLSLLVFGGSRGARSLNRAMAAARDGLAALAPAPRLVLQTGIEDEAELVRIYRGYPQERVEVHAFLDDMPRRLAEADLVVCRAGASTLSELAAAGRPALLVPYPHAADDHQRHNAQTVVEAGAARMILDEALDGEAIVRAVVELSNDRALLERMAGAARGLALPDATSRIAIEAFRLARCESGEGGAGVP